MGFIPVGPYTEHKQVCVVSNTAEDSKGQRASLTRTVIAGRFRLFECVQRDAAGAEYLARDGNLLNWARLRTFEHGNCPSLEKASTRKAVLRAAKAVASLRHHHIQPVHDSGLLEDGGIYVASPVATHRSVRAILQHGPLPTNLAIKVLTQLSATLRHTHSLGVVHGTVCPERVLLTGETTFEGILLRDLALARMVDAPGDQSQRYRATWASNDPVADDIHAIGTLGIEMLTGLWPLPNAVRARVPRAVSQVLYRCVGARGAHFESLEDVDDALRAAIGRMVRTVTLSACNAAMAEIALVEPSISVPRKPSRRP